MKRALITATLELSQEQGLAAISVREVARRAGVSPGAPFRHFENRDALLEAVAEESLRRLEGLYGETPSGDPLLALRDSFLALIRHAFRNPALIEFTSSRHLDWTGSNVRTKRNSELIAMTEQLLVQAVDAGQLHVERSRLKTVQIAMRSLAYGFARMHIDGHFPRWGIAESDAEAMAEAVLDLFIEGIKRLGPPIRQLSPSPTRKGEDRLLA